MLGYARAGVWPLRQERIPLARRLRDIGKVALNIGPVTTPYGGDENIRGLSRALRMGTRGWEYPWALQRLESLPNGSTVLDCGCGESGFPIEMRRRGLQVTGLDILCAAERGYAGYGIRRSHIRRLQGKVEFVNGSMHDIPLADNLFDVVTCISVMEHVVIEHKEQPEFHLKCLDEMTRVLKSGGLLVCTYDTPLSPEVVYAGTPQYGNSGWYYLDDIDYLLDKGMRPKDPASPRPTRRDIMLDEDAFFIPPDMYLTMGYGEGFCLFGSYHRLTSVGFVLVKT